MDDQQFDDVARSLARRPASRRLVTTGLLAALLPGTPLTGSLGALAKRHRKKKGRKGKGRKGKDNSKPDPTPPQSCSGGACAAEPIWVGHDDHIEHCEFICRQCDGDDSRDFCIVNEYIDEQLTRVARCCTDASPKCCGKECCDRDARCCDGKCCGGPNDPNATCCDGICCGGWTLPTSSAAMAGASTI